MCGMFTWYRRDGCCDAERAARAVLSMRHRGPDAQALYLWSPQTGGQLVSDLERSLESGALSGLRATVIIGHARLSVNDPTPRADQPMLAPDGQAVIGFNGTIYNFVELRAELEAEGETFVTTGDTEVLLRWLQSRGAQAVRPLNGAWAWAYLDMAAHRLVLSRDRYGERPLHFHRGDGELIAASEIKAIFAAREDLSRRLHPGRLMGYLAFRNWPAQDGSATLYAEIERMVPGTSLEIELDAGRLTEEAGNTLDSWVGAPPGPEHVAEDVRRAVELRLRADVPIGILVSGGIDSTLIAAFTVMALGKDCPVRFYTARFPAGTSTDLPFARQVAQDLGIELREVDVDISDDALDYMIRVTRQYDLPVPFGGATVGMNPIYRAMAEDGVRVVMDGTGGDEVFGGYSAYFQNAVTGLAMQGRWREAWAYFRAGLDSGWFERPHVQQWLYGKVMGRPFAGTPLRHLLTWVRPDFRQAAADSSRYYWNREHFRMTLAEVQLNDCMRGRMPGFTAYCDANAMMHSMEARSPFLDVNLAKYIALDETLKFRDGFNKWALRKVMPDCISPTVTWRREKQGARWALGPFIKRNEGLMKDKIRTSIVANRMFEVDGLFARLENHPIKSDMLLHLFSVALVEDIRGCGLD